MPFSAALALGRWGSAEGLVSEVIAAIVQVHAIAVARQGDIAAVGVHPRRRQDIGAVHAIYFTTFLW